MAQVRVEIPPDLLVRVTELAKALGVSPADFVADVVTQMVVANVADADFKSRVERGRQVTRERFLEILHSARDVEPEATDGID